MENKFKIVLFDLKQALVDAWIKTFPKNEYPFVSTKLCSFEALTGTALVSPANSFGFMNGGIDGAYTNYIGQQMVDLLQSKIKHTWSGELPIGCAEIVFIKHLKDQFEYLISAPTMRVPMRIDETANVYLATRAALLIFNKQINDNQFFQNITFGKEPTILIPGMGTGVGCVSPELCAMQMKMAIDDVMLDKFVFPKTLEDAYAKHVTLVSQTSNHRMR